MTDALPAAPDGRHAAVVHRSELPMRPFTDAGVGAGATFRTPIDETTDCRQLIQRVIHLGPGRTDDMRNDVSEDVLYVVEGRLVATVDGRGFDLEPASALLVPQGAAYAFEVPDGEEALLVSVLSPPPPRIRSEGRKGAERGDGLGRPRGEPLRPEGGTAMPAVTRERDQEPLPAGDDRYFKLMIDPRFGCGNVTQFLGFIERSRAPYHTHTYEEVIYILGGEGIVHIDDRHVPIHAGSSIFLPPGVPHCLENVTSDVLRLLGVFSPPGSPASKSGVPGT